MRQMMLKLWNDDCGQLYSIELVFVVTILVLGAITGLVALRQAEISELTELANALLSVNQSYSWSGQVNCESSTAGSAFTDACNEIFEVSVAPTCTGTGQNPCD
jgi:hypothetical protein